jgi:hypothetical protein
MAQFYLKEYNSPMNVEVTAGYFRGWRNILHLGVGATLVTAGNILQANVYGHPNSWKQLNHFLNDQTSLTSYGWVLAASGAANVHLGRMEMMFGQQGNQEMARLVHNAQTVVPIVLATANTIYEGAQVLGGDPRIDNHAMDILVGWVAAAQVISLNRYYDQRNRADLLSVS